MQTLDPITVPAAQVEGDNLPLFRQEVLEARTSQWMGRITLPQPVSYWTLTLLAALFAAAAVVFLCVGTYTRHESVQGQLVPSAGLLPVTARAVGSVTATRVREGQTVTRDQELVVLSGEINSVSGGKTQGVIIADLQAQLAELEALLESQKRLEQQQRENLAARVTMLNQQLLEIDQQAASQRERIGITERRLEKLRAGVKVGTFSGVESESYQAEVLSGSAQLNVLARQRLDVEQQLGSVQGQLQQLPLTTEAQRNELRFRILATKQSLAQNEAQRAVVLRAPQDGVVANLAVLDGQTVTAGQRLLSILPQGSLLQAELWLPSRAAGFLEAGNRVVLRYPAFPYQKFGQQGGWVQEISRGATAASELTSLLGRTISEPLYRVLVRLDQQAVNAHGRPEPLKPGMTVNADILLERRRLIEWVLEPLYGIKHSWQDPAPPRG